MSIIIGIDPGLSGALAVLDGGRLVELRDALVHADRVLSDGVRP